MASSSDTPTAPAADAEREMIDLYPGDSLLVLQADWRRHVREIATLTTRAERAEAEIARLRAVIEAARDAVGDIDLDSPLGREPTVPGKDGPTIWDYLDAALSETAPGGEAK